MLDQLISAVLQNVLQKEEARSAAADFFGMLATPAKRAAAMTGYLPEGYRWQTPTEASKWMEDAALGFVGSVTPKVGIRAYHGSPHDFDKFSMSKIGTGEGAQAYGHGLYFAEAEPVARAYRDALAWKNQRPFTVNLPGNPFSGAQMLEKDPTRPGRMYEVNIRANPNEFLDWDKPLSQQNPVSRAFLESLSNVPRPEPWRPSSVSGWLANHRFNQAEKNAPIGARYNDSIASPDFSKLANDAGIPGIRYLDQGSRAAGDGSRNYVLFRDDIIDILRKFLVPLTIGGGVLAEGTYSSPAKAAQ